MGLPCQNCHKDVAPEDAKIYSAVFVCPDCNTIALRFEERIMKELKSLQLIARESIRIALVKGELILGKANPVQDLSKKEVLESIIKMSEAKDVRDQRAAAQRSNPVQQPTPVAQGTRPLRQLGPRGGPRAQPRPVDLLGAHQPGDALDSDGSAPRS
jgi:hypothetical protein